MPEKGKDNHSSKDRGNGSWMNEAQQKAAGHFEGAMLVLAGPGSGKTRVITERIRHLIRVYHIPPEHILTITFTKKAALEMKERAVRLDRAAGFTVFGTFHAIFYHILLQSPKYHGMKLCTASHQKRILTKILYAYHYDTDQTTHLTEKILKEFSYIKNTGIKSDDYESKVLEKEQFCEIYRAYGTRLHQSGYIDFDDMLLLCYEYLKTDLEARKKWQEKFTFIQIDEYQDINAVQYAIIRLLAGKRQNVFAVGDDDQAIYGFRGSEPAYMTRFLEEFSDAGKILLNINYRCHGEIVRQAKKCISHNQNRFEKEIKAVRHEGEGVLYVPNRNYQEEAERVMERIRALRQAEKDCSIAILCRTNRQGSYLLEKLLRGKVPVHLEGKGEDFYAHPVVRDVLACFSFLYGQKRFHFLQFMNKPFRYISREAVRDEIVTEQALCGFYRTNDNLCSTIKTLFSDFEFMKECDCYSACMYFMKKMGYERYIEEETGSNREEREEYGLVVKELLLRLKEFPDIEGFLSFVKSRESAQSGAVEKRKKEKEEGAVQFLTYHASKGLEFDHVFLTGVNQGRVPHPRAVTKAELEEERRMFYVAMTRAKKSLTISFLVGDDENPEEPSVFVKDSQS